MTTDDLQVAREPRATEDDAQQAPRQSANTDLDYNTDNEVRRTRPATSGGEHLPPENSARVGGYVLVRSAGDTDDKWISNQLSTTHIVSGGEIVVPKSVALTVEPAVALVVGRNLRGSNLSVTDVLSALTLVHGALVVRADYKGNRTPDSLGVHEVVVSERSVALDRVDLRVLGYTFHVDGGQVTTGAVASIGRWVDAVRRLVDRLDEAGEELGQGSVLVFGSLTAAHPVAGALTVTTTFGRIGTLSTRLIPEN